MTLPQEDAAFRPGPTPQPPSVTSSSNTNTADTAATEGEGEGSPLPPSPPTVGSDIAAPPVALANTTIPAGSGLMLVRNPRGSDFASVYYLTLDLFGVQVAFEIGDQATFNELFAEGESVFDSKVTVEGSPPAEYVVGPLLADSGYLGLDESAQSILERELDALGAEGVAGWIRGDLEAMTTLVLANTNGWSAGKTWNELAKLDAFTSRFTGIAPYLESVGGNVQGAVTDYLREESSLRQAVRATRGGAYEITNEYLGQMLASGWTATTASPFLQAEAQLRNNPDAQRQANAILTASGLPAIDEAGLVSVMMGAAAPEITEALNTAFAAQALTEAGLEDLDLDLIASVVDDITTLRTPDAYRNLAAELSFNFIRYNREIGVNDMGITEDDLVSAVFGRESSSGKSVGQISNLLARFERDRQAAAQGVSPVTSFLDTRGRLRTPGLTALG